MLHLPSLIMMEILLIIWTYMYSVQLYSMVTHLLLTASQIWFIWVLFYYD